MLAVPTANWGPSTLATLFNHKWSRFVADPSTVGSHVGSHVTVPGDMFVATQLPSQTSGTVIMLEYQLIQ